MLSTALLGTAMVALTAIGCIQYPSRPDHAATDFVVDDPKLAAELEAAAADWADAGLVLANYVTVNQRADGVPVIFMTRKELRHNCNFDPKKVARKDPSTFIDGCTYYHKGDFEALKLADDLEPRRLSSVVRHELIHALVPQAEHVPDDQKAVFHRNGTSWIITMADVLHLEHFTEFER